MRKDEYENMHNLDEIHWWFRGVTAIVLSILDRTYKRASAMRILDAGSGTCWLGSALRRYGTVDALDIEPSLEPICLSRGVQRMIVAGVESIPVPDESYDLVVCSEVLYHLYVKDDQQAMREFYRILRPGGRLFVKVPAHKWLSGQHDRVNLTRKRYEKQDLRELFGNGGFVLEFLTYANFFLLPIVYLKRKFERGMSSHETSDIKRTNPIINWALFSIMRLEALILRHSALPQGASLIGVGRKRENN